MTKRILALDLGTRCGWAIGDGVGVPEFGAWDLAPKKGDPLGERWAGFSAGVTSACFDFGPEAIAHEAVVRHAGTRAAHVYGGFLAMVEIEARAWGATLLPFPVGTIKKHATGKGNASKEAMVAAANERWGLSLTDKQHDEADALWILDLALARANETDEERALRNEKAALAKQRKTRRKPAKRKKAAKTRLEYGSSGGRE